MDKQKVAANKKISKQRLAEIIRKIAREKNMGVSGAWTQKSILKS